MLRIQPWLEIRRAYEALEMCDERVRGQALDTAAGSEMKETVERLSGACPTSEEVRMVRALALSAVTEAVMRGESHASFRSFQVNAARLPRGHENRLFVSVELVVRLDGHIIDRAAAEISPLQFD
jgi:hypothetical protein